MVKCKYCEKEYSQKGIGTHIWRVHGEGKKHNPNIGYETDRQIWNKGLTKENDIRLKNSGETFSNNIKIGKTIHVWRGRKHTPETLLKLKQNGGVRKGAGRGKHGWYNGYWCDSSWELAFVIYNLEHGIKFERNKEGFEYIFENKLHKYYPDFILNDGTYIEIKGFIINKDKEKINQFKNKLIVLDKNKIKKYIDYSIEKYGKNYIYLYEKYVSLA